MKRRFNSACTRSCPQRSWRKEKETLFLPRHLRYSPPQAATVRSRRRRLSPHATAARRSSLHPGVARSCVVWTDKILATSDATVLGKTVIHAVTNPLSQFTGAIHV
jgi:hypothetical protein